ncbi:MAG TPA: AraC family transcriptional regulator [Lachnospiraceae bacterium]
MNKKRHLFLDNYNKHTFSPTTLSESFPLFVKECGHQKEKKLLFGTTNAYNEYLLLYSVSGTVRYTKGSSTNYVHANSVIISACNTPLTFTRVSKDWEFYYFIISGSHSRGFYNMVRTNSNIILAHPFSNILDNINSLYEILSNTSLQNKNQTWMHLQINAFLSGIFASLYDLTYNVNQIKKLTPPKESAVNTVLKYINENYKEDLSVDAICGKIGFSKHYFCRLFKEQTTKTLHQYINELRVNKAKEFLAYSKLSINSVANQVGFKTTLTFIRVFEKEVHMTPSEYRNYF